MFHFTLNLMFKLTVCGQISEYKVSEQSMGQIYKLPVYLNLEIYIFVVNRGLPRPPPVCGNIGNFCLFFIDGFPQCGWFQHPQKSLCGQTLEHIFIFSFAIYIFVHNLSSTLSANSDILEDNSVDVKINIVKEEKNCRREKGRHT